MGTVPNVTIVKDRFHVQKLALDAMQEIRIKHSRETIDAENDAKENAKDVNLKYVP